MNQTNLITFEEPIVELSSKLSYNIAQGKIQGIFESMKEFCLVKTVDSYVNKQNPISELDYNLIRNIETDMHRNIISQFHISLVNASAKMGADLDYLITPDNNRVFSRYRNLMYLDYCNPNIFFIHHTQIENDVFCKILWATSAKEIKDLEYVVKETDRIVDRATVITHLLGEAIYTSLQKTIDNFSRENMLDDESIEKVRMLVDKIFSKMMHSFTRSSKAFVISVSELYLYMIETRKRMFC